ncbi:MAG: energy-coupling factor transporter transmembrane component T [Candidatus Hodarchaeales archaeon]
MLLLVLNPLPLSILTTLIITEFLLIANIENLFSLLRGILPLLIFLSGSTWIFSGFEIAISVFFRILCGALGFSLFVVFTNPSDMTHFLESIKIPSKWALIPSLSLSFVPRVIKDVQETIDTLTLRGEIGGMRKVLLWLPKSLAIIVASILYRSEFLAQSLYFRGYGLGNRTHSRKLRVRKMDIIRFLLWFISSFFLISI